MLHSKISRHESKINMFGDWEGGGCGTEGGISLEIYGIISHWFKKLEKYLAACMMSIMYGVCMIRR